MSATRIAGLLGTSRAASHRFLSTLRDPGYVDKTAGGRFSLSFKVVELGMRKLEGLEIRHTAQPYMQALARAFGETVNLGHWENGQVLHLHKINSTKILRLDVGTGAVAPAYCTGLGKAVLAFQDPKEQEAYFKSLKMVAMSPKTITTIAELKLELECIRQCGYAIDDEELSLGLRCVGAPILDHRGTAAFALSVSGPSLRMTPERMRAIQAQLLPLCRELSRRIGAPENQEHRRSKFETL